MGSKIAKFATKFATKFTTKRATKTTAMIVIVGSLTTSLSACVGSNAVTDKVMQFNLEVVDNRYGRGGINILLIPVYALTLAVDVVIFNALEFWTGENPLNGEPHIFDSKVKTMYKVNEKVDPALTRPPLKPLQKTQVDHNSAEKSVYSMQVNPVNSKTIDYNIVYTNGEKAVLRGEKVGELVTFSLNGEFVTMASLDELSDFMTPKS
ncbi:DUF3332 family protein [Psychromonas sp. SA13A]|uniref:DUF3332 family protein n=1 Tax=Psychromonas sp. SA13A TaxID=2686346 RepID=UPI001F0D80CE|nr:DUF3332 family protein [Psychromonas sp. SA13A]